MKFFFSRTLLTLGVLALLGGCSTSDQLYRSWFGGHVQDGDEAPTPDASPSVPVESQQIGPQSSATGNGQEQVAVLNGPNMTPPGVTQSASTLPTMQATAPKTASAAAPPPAGPHAHTKVGILLPLTGKN